MAACRRGPAAAAAAKTTTRATPQHRNKSNNSNESFAARVPVAASFGAFAGRRLASSGTGLDGLAPAGRPAVRQYGAYGRGSPGSAGGWLLPASCAGVAHGAVSGSQGIVASGPSSAGGREAEGEQGGMYCGRGGAAAETTRRGRVRARWRGCYVPLQKGSETACVDWRWLPGDQAAQAQQLCSKRRHQRNSVTNASTETELGSVGGHRPPQLGVEGPRGQRTQYAACSGRKCTLPFTSPTHQRTKQLSATSRVPGAPRAAAACPR